MPLLAYFGHHKCASTWLGNICYSACHDLGLSLSVVYTSHDFEDDIVSYLDRERPAFFVYANADYRHVRLLPSHRGFHVVRDPRDVVVSAYFSHLHSHPTIAWPELVPHREKLRRVSKDEGLFLEMDFRAEQFAEMESWPDESPPNVLRLHMEDVTADPYNQLVRVFSFLGILDEHEYDAVRRTRFFLSKIAAKLRAKTGLKLHPLLARELPVERLLGIAWESRFSRQSGGRTEGQEDVKSHYRKGTAGDWLRHFNQEHLEYFRKRYSGVLVKYGYEVNDKWGDKYVALLPKA